MDYMHATLILHETGREINETNLKAVLEAAGTDVVESRVKAIVAALEGVDIEAIAPAPEFDPPDVDPDADILTEQEADVAGTADGVEEVEEVEGIDAEGDHDSAVGEEAEDESAGNDVRTAHDREDTGSEGEFEFSSSDGFDQRGEGIEDREIENGRGTVPADEDPDEGRGSPDGAGAG